MKRLFVIGFLLTFVSCKKEEKKLSVQQIVDKSITVSGGDRYNDAKVSFEFRGKTYISSLRDKKPVLERITYTDSVTIRDVKTKDVFQRFLNDSLVRIPDSLARRYKNSINSVHYFSRLPYGLNDAAVNKEFLGEVVLNHAEYYKVKVTFDEKGGGEDFDDVYLYWFNKETFKPDYLAYKFHVDGGGIRFRRAYNERFINGVRFVDYENYKANLEDYNFYKIDSVYEVSGLELLSKIELQQIAVGSGD